MGWRDDVFWAEFLGVEPEDWGTSGISYRSHAGLRGYRGFWSFRRNSRVVISAPPRWVERMRVMLADWDPDRLMDPAALAEAFGADVDRSIGPVFQGCLAAGQFTGKVSPHVRQLVPADRKAVDSFRMACGAEWDDCGLAKAELWRQAYFQGDRIAAMAGYRAWRDDAGDPCLLTHPEFRGGGRGAAVGSAVVAVALSNDKHLLYQTLEQNTAAVRIALSLGYERYGNHVAVRLKRETPEA